MTFLLNDKKIQPESNEDEEKEAVIREIEDLNHSELIKCRQN
jgi:hypothetical protein